MALSSSSSLSSSSATVLCVCLFHLFAVYASEFKVLPTTCEWSQYNEACRTAGYRPAVVKFPEEEEALKKILLSVNGESVWIKNVSRLSHNGLRERTFSDTPILLKLRQQKSLDFVKIGSDNRNGKVAPLCVHFPKTDRSEVVKSKTDSYISPLEQDNPDKSNAREKKSKTKKTSNKMKSKETKQQLSQSDVGVRSMPAGHVPSWMHSFSWTADMHEKKADDLIKAYQGDDGNSRSSKKPTKEVSDDIVVIDLNHPPSTTTSTSTNPQVGDRHVVQLSKDNSNKNRPVTTQHSIEFLQTAVTLPFSVEIGSANSRGTPLFNAPPVKTKKSLTLTKKTITGDEGGNDQDAETNDDLSQTTTVKRHEKQQLNATSASKKQAKGKGKTSLSLEAKATVTIPTDVAKTIKSFSNNQPDPHNDSNVDDDDDDTITTTTGVDCCSLI